MAVAFLAPSTDQLSVSFPFGPMAPGQATGPLYSGSPAVSVRKPPKLTCLAPSQLEVASPAVPSASVAVLASLENAPSAMPSPSVPTTVAAIATVQNIRPNTPRRFPVPFTIPDPFKSANPDREYLPTGPQVKPPRATIDIDIEQVLVGVETLDGDEIWDWTARIVGDQEKRVLRLQDLWSKVR